MLPAQPNRSLIDGLACLQALASRREPIGVRELARQLGLETTRAQRLVKTLAHLGLAEQDTDRKYRPGPGIHVLAAQAIFSSQLLQRAVGPLGQLLHLGLTVALGVLWRDRVAYLYHAEPGMSSEQAIGRVGLFPAEDSSIGMVLLNGSDHELVEQQSGRRSLAVPVGSPAVAAVALAGAVDRRRINVYLAELRQAAAAISPTTDSEA